MQHAEDHRVHLKKRTFWLIEINAEVVIENISSLEQMGLIEVV